MSKRCKENQRLSSLLPIMRCPYEALPLTMGKGEIYSEKQRYTIVNGIPNLVATDNLAALDELFQNQYGEKTARRYDMMLKMQSLLIGCREPSQRKRLVNLLNPPKGGRILEIAVGTGANLPYLARAIGPEGEIVALDLSLAMMEEAKRRIANLGIPVTFIRADGCFLPFKDDSFDAVFHFGGINMFGNIRKALAEMVRVAKPAAPIIVSDEGMSEKRRQTRLGRIVGNVNSLNLCRPPFDKLPWHEIRDFRLHWAWREIFYVHRFIKGVQEDIGPNKGTDEIIQDRIGPA